jgi:hypothetical protein
MIGDLSITQRALKQSSNSVQQQLVEARLGLAEASATSTGKAAVADTDASDAPPGSQPPAPISLTVKVLDTKA